MSPSYNGDIGMYYIRNRVWWLSKDTSAAQEGHQSPHVIHYTLGPTKPWLWWTYPLFELNFLWYSVFTSLPRSSYFRNQVYILCMCIVLTILCFLSQTVPFLYMLCVLRSPLHCSTPFSTCLLPSAPPPTSSPLALPLSNHSQGQ